MVLDFFCVCPNNSELDARNKMVCCHDASVKFPQCTSPISYTARYHKGDKGPKGKNLW